MFLDDHCPEGPGTRSLSNILLSEIERAFIRQFNGEAFSDRPGPAFSWLLHNDLAPDLMVAFQWALSPLGRLLPDPIDDTSCQIPFQPHVPQRGRSKLG